MGANEVIYTKVSTVRCDGGADALGHPLVYLNLGGKTAITCPYCSRRFVLEQPQAISQPGNVTAGAAG